MTNCPVCNSSKTEELFEIKNIPVYCNLMWDDKESATNCPKGDIKLEFCTNCGHVYNSSFDPNEMDYTQSYENSLHFSPRFQQFAEGLATDLIKKHSINKKNIVEIGCGKGDFLKMICRAGENKGIGFDRSYDPENETEESSDQNVSFIQEFYNIDHKDIPVDYLLCRHVLEHIEKPVEFLQEVKSIIGDRQSGIYFEVPNILYTLRDLGIWDLIYEHCGYFTPNSLAYLFKNEGLEVLHVEEKYGQQFLGIEAKTGDKNKSIDPDQSLDQVISLARKFSNAYKSKLSKWTNQLNAFSAQNKKVVVWGGGSKGVTFLNIINAKEKISAIVDINPRKQGKFSAGTGHEFISPEKLTTIQPDIIIAMNPIYKEEIISTVNKLGLTSKVIAENEL